jgi:precorrin-2/cobalt-factor-2 C20-methyltransferase
VPGITAMQALASASGTVLAEGEEPLTLLPLPSSPAGLADVLDTGATVVVYKGGRHLPRISAAVAATGRDAVLGEHVGLPGERILPLSEVDGPTAYLSTVLIPAKREDPR